MDQIKRDIIVTWPKTKPLQAYLADLERAWSTYSVINYRVSKPPRWPDSIETHGWIGWPYDPVREHRCYMVHSGFVRGWCEVFGASWREEGEVEGGWPAGWYIVRSALWMPVPKEISYQGFQGWRYFNYDQALKKDDE